MCSVRMTEPPEPAPVTLFAREIDRRLSAARPERYGPADIDWKSDTIAWGVANYPDHETAIADQVRAYVKRAEHQATLRLRSYLRHWKYNGRYLRVDEIGASPIVIDRTGTRVRYDAATPEDLDQAAALNDEQSEYAYQQRRAYSEAIRDLSRRARAAGLMHVAQLGDLAPSPIIPHPRRGDNNA